MLLVLLALLLCSYALQLLLLFVPQPHAVAAAVPHWVYQQVCSQVSASVRSVLLMLLRTILLQHSLVVVVAWCWHLLLLAQHKPPVWVLTAPELWRHWQALC